MGGKEGQEVIAGYFLCRFGLEFVEEAVVALHLGRVIAEGADFVGTDHEAGGEFFDEGNPVVGWFSVAHEVVIEDDPGEIDGEVRIGCEHALQFVGDGGDIDAAADSGMAPDDARFWVVADGGFDLVEIDGLPLPNGRDVAVDGDGNIVLGREIVDGVEAWGIGVGGFAVGEGSEVVVAGHDFADALPEMRIPFQHFADVLDGVAIGAIKAADKGVKAFAIGVRQGANFAGYFDIGGGIPVATGVVVEIVLGLEMFGGRPLFD